MTPKEMSIFGGVNPEQMGIRGDWFLLRATWNGKDYEKLEYSPDGEQWFPGMHNGNTISVRYLGGPKDGTVED